MTDLNSKPIALRQRREVVIARLCEHFAQDHLRAEELEARIDAAHAALSMEALNELLAGLPALSNEDNTVSQAVGPAMSDLEPSQTVAAILGGTERTGAWIPARTIRIFAVMGGAVVDFRDVRLPQGTIKLEVVAIMGGVEIIVPPGLKVSSDGIGIMGGFEHAADQAVRPELEGTMLRVTGIALMGGVEIKERHPGESSSQARRRRKKEAKLREQNRIKRLKRGGDL